MDLKLIKIEFDNDLSLQELTKALHSIARLIEYTEGLIEYTEELLEYTTKKLIEYTTEKLIEYTENVKLLREEGSARNHLFPLYKIEKLIEEYKGILIFYYTVQENLLLRIKELEIPAGI